MEAPDNPLIFNGYLATSSAKEKAKIDDIN
jgi:hypothetical protein